MGLVTQLLTLPLAPVRGVVWIAERVEEQAVREYCDPAVIRVRLASLNQDLEDGLISVEEFEQEEERLLDLLEIQAGTPSARKVRQ